VTHIWGPAASEEEDEGELESSFLLTIIMLLSHLAPLKNGGGNIDNDCLFLSVLLIINIGSLFSLLENTT